MYYKKRRGGYKKKRSYRKGLGYKSVYKIAKKAVMKSAETKYVQEALTGQFSSIGSATWSNTSVTGSVSAGYGLHDRTGCKIKAVGFRLRGFIEKGDSTNIVRVIAAFVNDDLDLTSPGIGLYDDVRGIQVKGIKKIAYDRYIQWDDVYTDTAGSITDNRSKLITINLKPKGIYKYYGDGFDAETETKFVVMMLSDSAAVAHPGFVSGEWTFWYKDM